jgi:hypothetical protein
VKGVNRPKWVKRANDLDRLNGVRGVNEHKQLRRNDEVKGINGVKGLTRVKCRSSLKNSKGKTR